MATASHAWKCPTCAKSCGADPSATAPTCPDCGGPLIAAPRRPPEPKPGTIEPAPAATRREQSRPINPFDALAEMASSATNWLPDADPGPSPSLKPLRPQPRRFTWSADPTPADEAQSSSRRPLLVVAVGIGAMLLGVVLTLALRPATAPHAQQQQLSTTAPRSIDLLALIDPQQDTVRGKWRAHLSETGQRLLESDATPQALISIPYAPPEEYDFRVQFTRLRGDNCLAQIFTHKNQAALILFGWRNTICGIQSVNGANADQNPTGVRKSLSNGQPHTSLLKVRTDRIEVYLDGNLLTRHLTTGSDLSNKGGWAAPTPLGLGSQISPMLIQSAELIEVSGHGHPLR